MARTKRRGRGEGSIFRRKDGLWCSSLTIGYDENGKRRRKDVYGKTKQEVRQKLLESQSNVCNGLTEPKRIKLSPYIS